MILSFFLSSHFVPLPLHPPLIAINQSFTQFLTKPNYDNFNNFLSQTKLAYEINTYKPSSSSSLTTLHSLQSPITPSSNIWTLLHKWRCTRDLHNTTYTCMIISDFASKKSMREGKEMMWGGGKVENKEREKKKKREREETTIDLKINQFNDWK